MDNLNDDPNTVAAVTEVMRQHLHPHTLLNQHKRGGWLSDSTSRAMRQVLKDRVLAFDYHRFSIRFGDANEAVIRGLRRLLGSVVPSYIAGAGVTDAEAAAFMETYKPRYQRQDIFVLHRLNEVQLTEKVHGYYKDFDLRSRKDKSLRLTQKDLDDFDKSFRASAEFGNEISVINVDYAAFISDYLHLIELRTTNDTNLPQAVTTVMGLLRAFVAAGDRQKRMAIGIVSDSHGTYPVDWRGHFAGEWKGHLGNRLHQGLFLIEEGLWKIVGPTGMSWHAFQQAVYDILVESFEWQAKTKEERDTILAAEDPKPKRARKSKKAEAAAAAQAKADTEAAEAAILAGLQNEEARANAAQLLTGVSRTIRDTVTVRLPLYSDLTIAKELSLSIPIVKAIRLLANQ
jgi:hypothetical protein